MLVADRYRLDESLGRGSMGEVWRATDQVLGRPVAVKLLHTDVPDRVGETEAERFRMEGRTAARLNHANVVAVYDFGARDGMLHLVMELVEGWSLAQERAGRGILHPWEAAGIAAQMAAGLAAAHREGVIHRDIKPANVMLTAERTAKITDFGLAKFAHEAAMALTGTGKVVGSAAYLAPERALSRPAQPASDVYSLGCVLYELLTGRPPFLGPTALSVVQQHVDAAPVPPAALRVEIPVPLSDYVLRLLAKDPALRPTAEEAAEWLANPAEPTGVPAPLPLPDQAPATAVLPAVQPLGTQALPGTEGLPTTTRSHAARRRGVSPKVLLALGGALVFAASAAIGVALSSGDGDDAAPGTTPLPPAATSAQPSTDPPTPSATPSSDDGRHGKDRGKNEDGDYGDEKKDEKRREKERDKDEDD
ncbi:protein kinase [Streptomyces cinnabarinus]|uniref:non-specific serine/threonine protein kinase n=1 Tax=Streptomyces cinnabarinus TaxID=67287 RepID=A0ABY7K8K3_9ACTN|nr:protein kinase [Streptomyces cinnabarinus]WAZ19878.1 protein kinase [Streptomyces cinnabarinus]